MMNEIEFLELKKLQNEFASLHSRVEIFGQALVNLEARLKARAAVVAPVVVPEATQPVAPPPLPVPPKLERAPDMEVALPSARIKTLTPPRLPEVEPAVAQIAVPPAAPAPESFELRMGTYWFVRLGVVMLLTALAIFAYYAYEHYIPHLGPWGKLTMLYLASGALLGFGAWQQRREVNEALKKFGEVVFAGGLAGVYFSTYAAHHIPYLQVIKSGLLDGVLLLIWVSFIVWLADRKRSETLALFAIALAYYTSIITNIGTFTLYSNFILTLAAVFFLVRNRWATLSFASLAATYFGYAYWRFYHGDWGFLSHTEIAENLWLGVAFLAGYWTAFTAAVFLSRSGPLSRPERLSYLSLNNGAFFLLVVLTFLRHHEGAFWKFSLGYGAALLALAALARFRLNEEPLIRRSYFAQGLLLVTVGLIAKFSGLQLALILAAESAGLLLFGHWQKNDIARAGACLTAMLATAWSVNFIGDGQKGLYTGVAVGGLLAFNAVWNRRFVSGTGREQLELGTAFFTFLALLTWLLTTWNHAPADTFALWLAGEALLFTVSYYALRTREIVICGQSFLVLAQVAWIVRSFRDTPPVPWWNPALIITITLVISHWWQRQKTLSNVKEFCLAIQGIFSFAVIWVLYFWLQPNFAPDQWLACTSLLAIAITVYGTVTRSWLLAICGQLFLVASCWQFVQLLFSAKPIWYLPLVPVLTLLLLSASVTRWLEGASPETDADRAVIPGVGTIYRWTALAMSLLWIDDYIPAPERCWFKMLLGAVLFIGGGWWQKREAFLLGGIYAVVALVNLWLPPGGAATVYVPNLLAILTLLSLQQLARKQPNRFPLDNVWHDLMMVAGGLSLWFYVSRWGSSGFYLSASWAGLALALFICGFLCRERTQRWLGLIILGGALGRVLVIDIWKLDTIYRIFSFFALGCVLILVGYIYTKYQEEFKEWL